MAPPGATALINGTLQPRRDGGKAEVSFQRLPEADRATNTQQTWRQEFLGCRSSTVERPSTRVSAAGTLLRFFYTIYENTSFWQLERLVTLSTYRRYTNNCIYLSVYLRQLLHRSLDRPA